MKDAVQQHPKDAKETVFGQLLQYKDELVKGDVYNHPDGKWVQIPDGPDGFIGGVIPKNCATKFVRPAKPA